jgi:transcription initiation factor TFIIH subunit 4
MFENRENYRYLIVESNFKIYAYTNSKLETQLIDFLFEIEYVFPNLIVGHITRSSVRKVMKRGVGHQKVFFYIILASSIYEYAFSSSK